MSIGFELYPIFYVVFGLVIGSFLTVCIFRLPFASLAEEQKLMEEGEAIPADVIKPLPDMGPALPAVPMEKVGINSPPRSFCPGCFKTLQWWQNIPLFSWIFLGGKCAYCKTPIPVRYPLIELTTAIFALLSFGQFGLTPTGFLIFVFTCALIVITVIDYDYYIIPNVISIPGTFIGIALAAVNHFFPIFTPPVVESIGHSLLGIAAGAGFLLLVSEFYLRVRKIEGLGMGDVKLLAMTGALFGPECSIYTIFVGSILGAVIGLGLMLLGGRKMDHPLPFGPYLAGATLIYIYGGPDIMARTMQLLTFQFN